MSLHKRIITGVTDERVWRRIAWMYVSFFLIFMPVTILSHFILPEGFLRGKHPIISALEFSPNVWLSTLQIFGYNLIPSALIMGASLLAQQSRLCEERYVPIGYTAFWGLTVLFAVIVGTWSFDIVTAAPPLLHRLLRILIVWHHAGLLEFSAYLLIATTSFKLTRWYSNRRETIAGKAWKDIDLSTSEKMLLILAFVLLLLAAFIESRGVIQMTG